VKKGGKFGKMRVKSLDVLVSAATSTLPIRGPSVAAAKAPAAPNPALFKNPRRL
jgi:hypothetical protein